MSLQLLLPLSAGLLYALASIVLKRATSDGAGPWRVTFVSNWVSGLAFAPLWFFGSEPFAWGHFWHAAIAGAAFFVGLVFTFLALSHGDVSVATPVLGTKVILVALLATFLAGESVPARWWVAAVLATAATALLGGGGGNAGDRRTFLRSLGYGLSAAASFALTDVLMQKWTHEWGFARFAPVMFLTVAVLSFGLVPHFRGRLRDLSASTWRWLLPGALLLAAQAACIAFAIASHGGATLVNILYASRGVWAVALVWAVGPWFQNHERTQGHGIMARRLAGSALLLGAIALAVI